MRLIVHQNYADASLWAAMYIAARIKSYSSTNAFVLGLPTGSSPCLIYKELVRMHHEKKLSFANVHTFNMDEYVGLAPDHPQSYHHFMAENLFDHIDIDKKNIRILDGMSPNPNEECAQYEKAIAADGGIELFLGGMGGNGHVAFNEPGSSLSSRTRVVKLASETKKANARFFGSEKVPDSALTVGVGTVMDAREVLIIVNGSHKARALKAVVEGGVNHLWTLSCLQMHPNAIIVCDKPAASKLQKSTLHHFMDIEAETLRNFHENGKVSPSGAVSGERG